MSTYSKKKKIKKNGTKQISSVVQWRECFNAYITAVSQHQPECMSDLLFYASLILRASCMYQGEGWLQYDCNFQKKLQASHPFAWAALTIPSGPWSSAAQPCDNIASCVSALTIQQGSVRCTSPHSAKSRNTVRASPVHGH